MSNTPQATELPKISELASTWRDPISTFASTDGCVSAVFLRFFYSNGISGASKINFAPRLSLKIQSSVFEDVNGQSLEFTAMESIGLRQPSKLVILSNR